MTLRKAAISNGLKIRKKALPKLTFKSPAPDAEKEVLTGFVQNMKASDLEERTCRALDALQSEGKIDGYQFRFVLGPGRGLPGWKELDILVIIAGGYYPLEVDDTTFVHKGSGNHDAVNEAYKMDYMRKMGLNPFPIKRIGTEQLKDISDAKKNIRLIYGL